MVDASLRVFGWKFILIISLSICNGSAKSFNSLKNSSDLRTDDNEVNVWLDSSDNDGGIYDDDSSTDPPNPATHRTVSFFRKYFSGILVGLLLLAVFGGWICWCRIQEAKYGEYGTGVQQKSIDVQTVKRGPGADLESYKESFTRLQQLGNITNDDVLFIPGGKFGGCVVKVSRPEDFTPSVSGAFRSQPSSSSNNPLPCKLKCVGGGACGGNNSRGAAKRQGYEMVREAYGPAN